MNGVQARAEAAWAHVRRRWERLGYASSLSQRVALCYFPVSLAGPMFIDRERFGGSLAVWLLISALAQLALMSAFEILRRAIHRPGRPQSQPVLTLAAILVASLFRGAALGVFVRWFGFSPDIELGYRLTASLTAAAMIIVIALVVSAHERHRGLVKQLDRERAGLADLDISMQGRLAEITRGVTALVTSKVEPRLKELDAALSEVASGADVAPSLQSLRHLVDDELRPLSHQLSIETVDLDVLALPVTQSTRPRVPLPEFLHVRDALLPGTSGVLTMLSALGPAFRELTLVQSLAFLLGLGACVAFGVGGLRAFAGRVRLPVFVCIAATSMAMSIVVALGVVILGRVGLTVPDHIVIPALIIGGVIGAGAALYCAVDERRSLTEAHLLEAVQNLQSSVSRLRQQAWIGRRRVSYILHGSVQSALHSAAMRLTAHPHPDSALIAEIRHDIAAAMAKLGSMSGPPTVLPEALAETANLWSEACTVRWHLSEDAQLLAAQNATTAECASEIVREGVGNAIRHGGATHVDVTIIARLRRLVLVIADDGCAGHDAVYRGLGSRMLDEMCVRWSRESDVRGTRLTAELAT